MDYINLASLLERQEKMRKNFNAKQVFRYIVIEDFFKADQATHILQNYPDLSQGSWDGTTYINQKNKFQQRTFEKDSVFYAVFSELNSPEFIQFLEGLTDIEQLQGDEALFGGGLHQSTKGAFLNVHVDYNIHPESKYHRRLNVLVYMNENWEEAYEGHLELWDMQQQQLLEKIVPTFNRCVIFETNQISYHGHPKPLRTPRGISRKSIATYYYTPTRPQQETEAAHNTKFVNTEGLSGQLKRLKSGLKAFVERKL